MTKSEYVKLVFEQMCGNTTSEDCQFFKNTTAPLWNLAYTALKNYEEELAQVISIFKHSFHCLLFMQKI